MCQQVLWALPSKYGSDSDTILPLTQLAASSVAIAPAPGLLEPPCWPLLLLHLLLRVWFQRSNQSDLFQTEVRSCVLMPPPHLE